MERNGVSVPVFTLKLSWVILTSAVPSMMRTKLWFGLPEKLMTDEVGV